MKKIALISTVVASLAFAAVAYAKSDKENRKTASVLDIDLKGLYISPARGHAQIQLQGQDLKIHLMSRFSDDSGKAKALKVTAECTDENSCVLNLSQ